MKTMMEYDFEYYFERFVERLADGDKQLYKKVFDKSFKEIERDISDILMHLHISIEENLSHFKEEIAKEIASEFCQDYWNKWEDGHDWEEGMQAICYFKETDKYFVGTCVNTENEGNSFLMQDGKIYDPDYVAPLYKFVEKEKDK
jgi:hypothetical protein